MALNQFKFQAHNETDFLLMAQPDEEDKSLVRWSYRQFVGGKMTGSYLLKIYIEQFE